MCEIWSVADGGRHHPGRSSKEVDGGAGQRRGFRLQFGHEKSHVAKVIVEQSLEE